MSNELPMWNGYPIHGNVTELDGIIEAPGFIKLNKDDIESVLSSDGENFVTTGTDADLSEALNKAINDLPCKIGNVNKLLIDFRFGSKQPDMSELSSITATLSASNAIIDIGWGISPDESLGESYKVILLASVKA